MKVFAKLTNRQNASLLRIMLKLRETARRSRVTAARLRTVLRSMKESDEAYYDVRDAIFNANHAATVEYLAEELNHEMPFSLDEVLTDRDLVRVARIIAQEAK